MNYLDILILIPIVWFAYKGFSHGFIREIFAIIALILGLYCSFPLTDDISQWIGNENIPQAVYTAICFLLIIILTSVIGKLVEKIIKLIIPELINNLAGSIFSIAKVLTICSMILFFIESIDSKERILTKEVKEKSFLYPYTQPIVPIIKDWYEK